MQAHIERLATFAQHGQPKDYAASDMMRADLGALIMQVIAQPASPVQAEPVMYQERTDLRGPYSSFQGWTDWRECDKEQYEMIQEHPTIYYTAQSRALIVAAIAHPVQPVTKE